MYEIIYADAVVAEDVPILLDPWKTEISHAIETKLSTRPEVYSKPLRRSLKGYRKLKVGAYRVVFRIDGNKIKVFVIQHRSTVYVTAPERL